MSILLLAGSPSVTSRSTQLLKHIAAQLQGRGHDIASLHVQDLPAQALLQANLDDVDIMCARHQVKRATAIVIGTPVYKASYAGILKAFLDLLPQDGFAEKIILPLATGGSPGHMLAIDYALRPVLSAMGARHVLPSIYATDIEIRYLPGSLLSLDPALEHRIARGVDQLSVSVGMPHAPLRAAGEHAQAM